MHTNAVTITKKNTANIIIGANVAIIPYQHRGAKAVGMVQYIPNPIPVPFFGPIVPYVAREVFPLRVVYYILQEDDWGVDDHGNHQHNNNNIHVQHIHVPIALALHPNTVLSHGRHCRENNLRQNQNVRRRYDHCYENDQNECEHNPKNRGDDHIRRKRMKLNGGGGTDPSRKNWIHLCPNSMTGTVNKECSDHENRINLIEKVCDIEGILEQILRYNHNDPLDLLSASLVSRRWLEASRNDHLWKCTCEYVWGDKVGMPLVRRARGGSIGLFWRSLWKEEVIRSTTSVSREFSLSRRSGISSTCSYEGIQSKMTVRDIKGLFGERPLGRKIVRDAFGACVEKCDMQKAVLDLMPDSLGGEECGMDPSHTLKRARGDGFNYLWFGSFASSIIDSKRTVMTMDELLSRKGFLMHFKVYRHDGSEDDHGRRHRYGRRRRCGEDSEGEEEDVSLHFHCICYFDEAYEGDEEDGSEPYMGNFRLDDSNSRDLEHPQNLTWHWLLKGKTLQVGQYPPLVVRRLNDWGWRIENHHVVLYSQ